MAKKNPLSTNYIRIRLTIANTVDFDSLQTKLNARLPEIHEENRVYRAYSHCVEPVTVGLLLRSHWKDIRIDNLQAVYSMGSNLTISLHTKDIIQRRRGQPVSLKEDGTRAAQAIHIECEWKEIFHTMAFFKNIYL